jgi:hypothetical protein
MELIALFINLVAAIWVYTDAKMRGKSNRSAFLWSLGTFLFLIVFLPIWLFSRPKLPEDFSAAGRLCRRCGNEYEDDPFYCPHCAYPLRTGRG